MADQPTTPVSPSSTSPASSPAGNTPPVPAGGPPSPTTSPTEPLPDWQARYTELEGKYTPWKDFGEPASVKQTVDFAKQIVQALQSGQSAVYDPETGKVLFKAPQPTPAGQPPTDPFDGIDDLPPREMAARLRDVVRNELAGTVKADVDGVKKLIQDALGNLGGQQKLFMKAARLAQTNPEVPFEQLVALATEMSSKNPEELLDAALAQALAPGQQKKIIEQKVQEALALRQQEADNAEAQMLAPKTSAFMTRAMATEQEAKDGNPVEARNKRRVALVRQIRDIANKARKAS